MIEVDSIFPVRDAVSEPWFAGIDARKLLLQRDPQTGKAQFYPRGHVMGALNREPEWFEASGLGKLHTYTVVKRSVHPQFTAATPFTLAIVELAEGPRMTSWVVDVPEEELRCDMPVRLVFREIHPGLIMPCFTKA
jgi:uncharacterized OB-fold protein